METHPDPDRAISDGPNMVPLGDLDTLLARCLGVWRAVRA
jgi:2-dehydro-3-deoxyphosphooctonate aldolase (KDO 8-P synthase)